MRLPRVRLSMGMMLVLVAVAAGNLGVLRFLLTQDQNSSLVHSFWVQIAGPLLGFLPLINIALIGFSAYALRWMHRPRPDEAGLSNQPAPAALTFFSLHLVVIAFLIVVCMPAALSSYLERMTRPIWLFIATSSWTKDGVLDKDNSASLAFGTMLNAILCSGPLLVLAGIGAILARRYASAIPRGRFRVMTGLVSSGFAAVALAIAVSPQAFAEDDYQVALSFRIVDEGSAKPVRSAFVRLIDPFHADSLPSRGLTDADGRVELTDHLKVTGEANLFGTMGSIDTWGRWLEVSAPGYQTVHLALPAVIAPAVGLESPAVGQVALTRGRTPEPQFRDLAGHYRPQVGTNGIEIDPEGRFVWRASGCFYYAEDYGYLKRDEGEFALVSIAHPGEEARFSMTLKYRLVAWGDRLYLVSMNPGGIQSFCRAALDPYRRTEVLLSGTLFRASGSEKPLTGFPQLPASVWAGFAFNEINIRNEHGIVRQALRSLGEKLFGSPDDSDVSLPLELGSLQ